MLDDLGRGDEVIRLAQIHLFRAEIEIIAISLVAILPFQQSCQDWGRATAKIKGCPPFWSKGEDGPFYKIPEIGNIARIKGGVLMQAVLLEGLLIARMASSVERDEFTPWTEAVDSPLGVCDS